MEDIRVGDRVKIHPATDLWMRGVRFARVVKITARYVHVKALGWPHLSERVIRLAHDNVLPDYELSPWLGEPID